VSGNYLARRRLVLFRKFLEYLGIHPNRFRISWVSASEGGKFSEVIKEVTEGVKTLGPLESLKREQVWLPRV
jgi:coenzyme F420-reducing hydrogenase delta subunit